MKKSKLCIVAGIICLVATVIASYYNMAYEIYLMAALLFLIEGIVCYFSKKNVRLNCIVALIAYAEIVFSFLGGAYPLSIIGFAILVIYMVINRSKFKN